MAELKTTIRDLQRKFDDPDLYSRDAAAFAATSDALVAAQTELAEAEEKWLELEILREEIEG
jgi:ABC transport system ATP-binding/permease protein